MKTLAITFFTAVAIIGIALVCDYASTTISASDNALVGRTTITRDSQGRVVSEVTVAINGKEWQETAMKQLSYYDNKTEAVTYKKVDGVWIPTSKLVTETEDGMPVSYAYFTSAPNGSWIELAQQQADDLSSSDVLDDVVFDANGNVVMKATYVYHNGERTGIEKEEYAYEGNTPKSRVSYAWSGNGWNKSLFSEYVAE